MMPPFTGAKVGADLFERRLGSVADLGLLIHGLALRISYHPEYDTVMN